MSLGKNDVGGWLSIPRRRQQASTENQYGIAGLGTAIPDTPTTGTTDPGTTDPGTTDRPPVTDVLHRRRPDTYTGGGYIGGVGGRRNDPLTGTYDPSWKLPTIRTGENVGSALGKFYTGTGMFRDQGGRQVTRRAEALRRRVSVGDAAGTGRNQRANAAQLQNIISMGKIPIVGQGQGTGLRSLGFLTAGMIAKIKAGAALHSVANFTTAQKAAIRATPWWAANRTGTTGGGGGGGGGGSGTANLLGGVGGAGLTTKATGMPVQSNAPGLKSLGFLSPAQVARIRAGANLRSVGNFSEAQKARIRATPYWQSNRAGG